MGKYASGLTVNDICKAEVAEVKKILEMYKISAADAELIIGTITEAYFQLNKAFASDRANIRLFEKVVGKHLDVSYFRRFTELYEEEQIKFPFDVPDDNE